MHSSKIAMMFGALLPGVMLGGCKTTTDNPNLPVGESAYAVIPATVPPSEEYAVRPLDVLTIRVFGEPEISSDAVRVDEVGQIQVPLIGAIQVAGHNATQISEQIKNRLAASYLRDPQVAVSVKEAAPSFVSVEGEVKKPGVYEINKGSTLLSAIARAESPTATARLDEIVIFRTVGEQRMVARFNLKDIRTGVSPDPAILDGDVVMVGYSTMRGLWQDILRAAPLFNAFAVLNREI